MSKDEKTLESKEKKRVFGPRKADFMNGLVFIARSLGQLNKNVGRMIEGNSLEDHKDSRTYNPTMTYLQTLSWIGVDIG